MSGYLEGLLYLIPVKMIMAWYLPFFLYTFVEFFLTQSEHYGTEEKGGSGFVPLAIQYGVSWNLKLPAIIEFMVARRNLHAEHHLYPGIHWSRASDKKIGRTLPLSDYMRSWWTNGPRTIDPG